ncbi:hypothetical protein GTQ43_04940 [Nostoc sp. KVJ3]|uniref:hypothetical protein n=1 Tax=Nostoc sp. KVJ3 TaxID=457945 RepID=UPI002238336F|nr:hypothetical protein [Nostoc sp. KVJ3]MCW5313183.1 hypothetical protein [Nostoc sp. KVJ3]
MKLSILIDSVLIVASIALLPGIGGAQTAINNSGEPIAIKSNNLPTYSNTLGLRVIGVNNRSLKTQ